MKLLLFIQGLAIITVLTVSAEDEGEWTPCSASCGYGSKSRVLNGVVLESQCCSVSCEEVAEQPPEGGTEDETPGSDDTGNSSEDGGDDGEGAGESGDGASAGESDDDGASAGESGGDGASAGESDNGANAGESDDGASTGEPDDDDSSAGESHDDGSSVGESDDGASAGESDDGSSTGESDDGASAGESDDGPSAGESDDGASAGESDHDDPSAGESDDGASEGESDDDGASTGEPDDNGEGESDEGSHPFTDAGIGVENALSRFEQRKKTLRDARELATKPYISATVTFDVHRKKRSSEDKCFVFVADSLSKPNKLYMLDTSSSSGPHFADTETFPDFKISAMSKKGDKLFFMTFDADAGQSHIYVTPLDTVHGYMLRYDRLSTTLDHRSCALIVEEYESTHSYKMFVSLQSYGILDISNSGIIPIYENERHSCYGMALDEDMRRLYFSDYMADTVTCLDLNTYDVTIIISGAIFGPCGLLLPKAGNILLIQKYIGGEVYGLSLHDIYNILDHEDVEPDEVDEAIEDKLFKVLEKDSYEETSSIAECGGVIYQSYLTKGNMLLRSQECGVVPQKFCPCPDDDCIGGTNVAA